MSIGNLVSLATASTATTANSVSVTVPNNGTVVVGDLLIWMGGVASGTRTFTVSGVSNFTFAGSGSQSGSGSHVWYKICESADLGATITLTPSTGSTTLIMLLGKVSGVDTTNPFDTTPKIASNTTASNTSKTTPSVTTVAANSREISILFDTRSGTTPNTTTWTAPSGETRQGQVSSADASPRLSAAFGDSNATVSGTVGARVWTADQAAPGSTWTMAAKEGGALLTTSPSDSEGLTDNLTLAVTAVQSNSDAEGLTDNLSLAVTAVSSLPETEGLTDSLSVALTLPLTLPEALGLTDSLSLTLGSAFSDSEGLSDNVTFASTAAPSFGEAEGLTDNLTLAVTAVTSYPDSEGLTDNVTVALTASPTFPEALGLSDSVVINLAAVLTANSADAEGLTDNVTFAVTANSSYPDSEGLTDNLTLAVTAATSFPDSEGLTDNVTFAVTARPTFPEPMGLSDSVVVSLASVFTVNNSDAEGLTDSLTAGLTMPKAFSDASGLTDSIVFALGPPEAPGVPNFSGYATTLVLGPVSIYVGAFGAVEPSGATLWSPDLAVWTDVGGTQDGMEITVQQEYQTIDLVQLPDQSFRRLKKRSLTATTSLAEPTLQNMLYTLNSGTITTGAGWQEYSAPTAIDEGTPLDYRAVLIYGWAPGYNKRRLVTLRKCLSTENSGFAYKKDGQTVIAMGWSVHYVSSSIAPFRITDQA